MRRYNIISRILLILTISTIALAAPVLVQEKRQAPGDVITAFGKRALAEIREALWEDWWHFRPGDVLEDALPPEMLAEPEPVPPPNPVGAHAPEVHAPQPNPAEEHEPEIFAPAPDPPNVLVPEGHAPPPNRPLLHVVNVLAPPPNPVRVDVVRANFPPHGPADSDHESMELNEVAPPGNPQSGHSPPGPSTGSQIRTIGQRSRMRLARSPSPRILKLLTLT